jgi:hypothetical protein
LEKSKKLSKFNVFFWVFINFRQWVLPCQKNIEGFPNFLTYLFDMLLVLVKSSFRWSPVHLFQKIEKFLLGGICNFVILFFDKRLFQNHNVKKNKIQCEIDFFTTRCSLVTFCGIQWQMWHVLCHCWKHLNLNFTYYVAFLIYKYMGSFYSFFAKCCSFMLPNFSSLLVAFDTTNK